MIIRTASTTTLLKRDITRHIRVWNLQAKYILFLFNALNGFLSSLLL